MPPADADPTPSVASQGAGVEDANTASEPQPDLVDVMRAAGEAESLPMHLALARTRARLFDLRPAPARLGRFELLEVIGRGATAVVHTAHDPRLNRVVALKVFPRDLDSVTSARVMREARLAASLNHPNVVTVLDVGESGGRIWVAMERCEGQTLRDVLRRTPSSWAALAPFFLPVAVGLQEVHRHGIVHRDVKPENILVDSAGRVVLTDFGVATRGPLDSEAGVGGTPVYMSPEQLGGGLVGPASDQFSYCVTLFEALEGERPFPAATAAGRLEAIRGGPTAVLSNTSVPKSVRAVLERGLAFDADARFASMANLVTALGHRRRRWWVPALSVGGAILAASSMSAWGHAPETCQEETASTRETWTSVRSEVEAAFALGPEAFVVDGGPRVLANLDRYVEELGGAGLTVCEAVQRKTLASDTATGRAQCLVRRHNTLERFIGSLDETQGRIDAIAGSYKLPPVESCLSDESVARVPEALRSDVEALNAELDALNERDGTQSPAGRLAYANTIVIRTHALGHRPLSVRALTALGNARMTVGDFDGARQAWEDGYFQALRERMPESSLKLATAVVGALASLGNYAEARTWARHARAAVGRTPEPIAASGVDYAEAAVLLMMGRPEEALPLLEKTLQTRSALLGANHPMLADTHLELGNAYLAMEEFDRALAELRTARKINEVALGPRHPDLSIVDNNLGAVEFHLGRIDAAAQRWKQSLSIGAEAFGENHISQHGTLTNLAKASAVQEDWGEAEAYVDRALQVWDAAGLGDAHPELAGTLEVQGQILLERGAAKKALQAFVHAIEICDAVYGSVEVPTLGSLAGATRAAWALDDAEATARHAQRFLDSPDSRRFSPETHTGIVWLQAQALWATGGHAESRTAAQRALESYREMDDAEAARSIEQWLRVHED